MAEEYDRKIMPDMLQTGLSVWLGAMYRSVEMMKNPQDALDKMVSGAKDLVTIPADAPDDLQGKVKALAESWMGKGADLMDDCRKAGEKFTEGKSG